MHHVVWICGGVMNGWDWGTYFITRSGLIYNILWYIEWGQISLFDMACASLICPTINWFWEGATAAMQLCIKVCLRRRVLINNNQMTVSQMAHNKQSTSKKRAAIVKASCVQITWYNKLQWRECAVLCQRLCHYGHSPEGFCMKTLFDNDWEGRANRSQHAHGKQRYYQFKWNIFTMMFIYEICPYII